MSRVSRELIHDGGPASDAGRAHFIAPATTRPAPSATRAQDAHVGVSSDASIRSVISTAIVVTVAIPANHARENAPAVAFGRSVSSSRMAGMIPNGDAAIPRAATTASPTRPFWPTPGWSSGHSRMRPAGERPPANGRRHGHRSRGTCPPASRGADPFARAAAATRSVARATASDADRGSTHASSPRTRADTASTMRR